MAFLYLPIAQTSAHYQYRCRFLFASDNLFWGGQENYSLLLKIIFSSPQNKLSDVNTTYSGNGQKFELSIIFEISVIY
jgi:hypothetical protein